MSSVAHQTQVVGDTHIKGTGTCQTFKGFKNTDLVILGLSSLRGPTATLKAVQLVPPKGKEIFPPAPTKLGLGTSLGVFSSTTSLFIWDSPQGHQVSAYLQCP